MSMFDSLMREGGVPTLMGALGDAEGVTIETPTGVRTYPAAVGPLRTEEGTSFVGTIERTVNRDVCQVRIDCPRGTFHVQQKLIVAKHTSGAPPGGDMSAHDGQAFHVRSIDGELESLTTLTCWRESLAKLQRRGVEAG